MTHPSRRSAIPSLRQVVPALLLVPALTGLLSPAMAAGALAASGLAVTPSPSDNLVVVKLDSDQNGQTVAPGQQVGWSLRVQVIRGGNLGLALISIDLAPDESNPEPLDLEPGLIGSEAMAVFDRPLGFANPADDPWGSAYGGTPVDGRLVQIGGAQNVFGVAPECLGPDRDVCMGQNVNVVTGVGQNAGGVIVATGFVSAGTTPGNYRLRVGSVLANVVRRAALAPWVSWAERAPVRLGDDAEISFTVQ